MNCPTCSDERLVMTERAGIEIDYCPACRGVWLDRGELDKIIERSAGVPAAVEPPSPPVRDAPSTLRQREGWEDRTDQGPRNDSRAGRDLLDDRFDDRDRFDERDAGRRPRKRRESLLSELFDF